MGSAPRKTDALTAGSRSLRTVHLSKLRKAVFRRTVLIACVAFMLYWLEGAESGRYSELSSTLSRKFKGGILPSVVQRHKGAVSPAGVPFCTVNIEDSEDLHPQVGPDLGNGNSLGLWTCVEGVLLGVTGGVMAAGLSVVWSLQEKVCGKATGASSVKFEFKQGEKPKLDVGGGNSKKGSGCKEQGHLELEIGMEDESDQVTISCDGKEVPKTQNTDTRKTVKVDCQNVPPLQSNAVTKCTSDETHAGCLGKFRRHKKAGEGYRRLLADEDY